MPLRSGNTYVVPGKGVVNTRKKTFTGKGKGPAGTGKVAAPKSSEVPTVTTSPSGKVTASGFRSQKAATRAVRRQKTARARVRRVQHQLLPAPQKRSQRATRIASSLYDRAERKPETKAEWNAFASLTSKEAKVSAPTAQKAVAKIAPPPSSKPPKFQGSKTAGTPTLKELQAGAESESLGVNKRGYLTTSKVRKVSRQIRKVKARARRSAGPLPGLGPAESKVARKVLRTGRQMGATRKELLAAAETGLVESGFRNLGYGDADSEGWRQERTSIYGTGPKGPRNVKASAKRFFQEARTDAGTQTAPTAGLLAQAAQGSAFPKRYDERKPEAAAILRAFQKGSPSPKDAKRLRRLTAKAQRLGLKGVTGPELVAKQVKTRFKAIRHFAKELEKAEVPYVYGGGHEAGTPKNPKAGLDCSSSTVWVLNKAGVKIPNIVSGEFGNYLEPGPGAVTVFYNEGHVFMRIGNKYWGTSRTNPNSGPGFIEGGYDDSYLSQYNVGHVPGLGKKVAVQMGISLKGGGSFPGVTLSSSGTTATVDQSAATTRQKPGFSSKPISPAQRRQQTLERLEAVGVGNKETERSRPAGATSLAALERKYGAAA